MMYALKMEDGSVGVMVVAPIAIEINGIQHKIARTKEHTDGVLLIAESGSWLVPGVININDIMPDSIKDATIIFPSAIDCLAKWHPDESKKVQSHREMSMSELPLDRGFRNAWEDTGVVSVNMGRAREIHRENLRTLRAPLLADLDMQYMRADETSDATAKANIASKKQALRDVTDDPAIDAAKTPEELKAVLPDVLKVDVVTVGMAEAVRK